MANIVIDKSTLRQVHAGQNGYIELSGIAHFAGVEANALMDCGIQNVEGVQLTPIGAPATDETLYVNEVPASGIIQREATKTISIGRTGASPTSALKFAFRYWGH